MKILGKLKKYAQAKRYREVRTACESLLKLDAKNEGAMLLLAEVSYLSTKYEKAIELCNKLWKSHSKVLDVNLLLARAHLKAGNFDEALEVATRAQGLKSTGNNVTEAQLVEKKLEMAYSR